MCLNLWSNAVQAEYKQMMGKLTTLNAAFQLTLVVTGKFSEWALHAKLKKYFVIFAVAHQTDVLNSRPVQKDAKYVRGHI